MKVEIEKLPESKVKLKIEVPQEKVDEYLKKAYVELSKNLNIPGFRSGHIPPNLVEQKVGSQVVHEEAIRLLVPHAYVEAISQEKIMAIGRPEIKVTKFAPGNPAEIEAEVAVVPEVELSDYKNIKIEEREIKVEDSEVDEVLRSLQKKEAKLTPKEGQVEKGDWVEIDFDGSKNGILLEKLKSRNHPFITGEGVLLEDFEKNIIGLKAGGEKEFDITFPKDYYEKDLVSQNIHFKLKVLKVQKVELPEINDEFVKKISGGTDKRLDELKEDIKTALKKQKEHEEHIRKEGEVIKQATEKAKVLIPKVLIGEEIEEMKKDLEQKLEKQGLKLSRYLEHLGKTEEQLKDDLREDAERRIKVGLVLNKVAEVENIEVSDEETETEIQKTREEVKKTGSEEASKHNLESLEVKRYIKTVLRNRKTVDRLLEYAKR